MNNLPLQPLKWFEAEHSVGFIPNIGAQGAGIFYRIAKVGDKAAVTWHDQSEGSTGAKELGSVCEAKSWIETDHYPSKIQPYVMPSPTWFNYETEKPTQGDSIVIAWVWMGDKHTIWLESYRPAEIDYLDDCLEVYWSFSPFVKQGE